MPDACLIRSNFNKSASSYDRHALIQDHTAETLLNKLNVVSPTRVLELGCGTGILSQHLIKKFPEAQFTFTDLSPAMLELAKTKLVSHADMDFQCLNVETACLDGPYDLIIANMVVHWFTDISDALLHIQSALSDHGRFYFSTIGARCFPEWQHVIEQHHLPIGLRIAEQIEGIIAEEFKSVSYPSAYDFLHSLKATGAQFPRSGYQPIGPGQLKRVLRSLDQNGSPTLTWHILYGCFGSGFTSD